MKDDQETAGQHVGELRIFRGDEAYDSLDREFDRQDRDLEKELEAFWAGRNLAMRRSARVAA